MKVVLAEELGPPERYELCERPRPEPGPGEVLVRTLAAGVGYFDALMARGGYQIRPPVPFVPGSEFSGVVERCGPGVDGPSPGQRVIGGSFGNVFAEYLCVPAATLIPMPAALDADVAAAFLVNHQTAAHALIQRAGLVAGETLLVLGAAGGTGTAAVQVGKCLGARVIAAASTPEKRAFALAAGADLAIDYSRPDWREALKQACPGGGVDVVFDPVGGDVFEPAFRSLAWGGRHLVIGFAGGAIPRLPANLALLKGASLVGVDLRQAAAREPAMNAANTRRLLGWVEDGSLRPLAGPVFAFTDFRAALEAAFSGKSLGKVVLRIAAA